MLKKISTIILAALLLSSCATLTRERSVGVYFASFQNYPDLWISPNDCPMQHTVLGHLIIEVAPAILPPQRAKDGVYSSNINAMQYERISYDELLEMAVVEARARGANGISNFDVKQDRAQGSNIVTAYYVTGLLIKIE